jgi:two-component sensor histidine kinase
MPLGEGLNGSILNGNYAATRDTSGWKSTVQHHSSPDKISMAGPDLRVRADVAQAHGLAIHELYTNAVKYGALSTHVSRVAIEWNVEQTGPKTRNLL